MAEEAKRGGGGMQRLVLWILIAALLAMVWMLASERNERRYRLGAENGQLVIERGRYFPTGSVASTDRIYAPLALPAGEKPPGDLEFDDQNALDQYLFGLFGSWAKEATKKGDTRTAAALVERASQLPGLTGGQLADLAALRAGLAWDEAHADVLKAADLLDGAARKLKLVEATNGAHALEAAQERAALSGLADSLRSPPPKGKAPAPPAVQPAK